MPSVTTQPKESEVPDTKSSPRGYSVVSPTEDKDEDVWRRTGERNEIELPVIEGFSNYKPIDVDILLDNMKVHLLPFPLKVFHEKKPSSADFSFSLLLVVELFFTELIWCVSSFSGFPGYVKQLFKDFP